MVHCTVEELRKRFPVEDIFRRACMEIQAWPDLQFETADGRRFLMFFGGDSIRRRVEAAEGVDLSEAEIEKLDVLHGMISEADSEDEPMRFYASDEEIRDAWLELHRLHREPLSRKEIEFFGVSNEELFDAEDSAT